MKIYDVFAGLIVLAATICSGMIASHSMLNQPKSPSMLVK